METKSGVKTSEFWAMAVLVCSLLGAALPATIAYVPEGGLAWVIMSIVVSVTGAVMAFIKSRGLVKATASTIPLPPAPAPAPKL